MLSLRGLSQREESFCWFSPKCRERSHSSVLVWRKKIHYFAVDCVTFRSTCTRWLVSFGHLHICILYFDLFSSTGKSSSNLYILSHSGKVHAKNVNGCYVSRKAALNYVQYAGNCVTFAFDLRSMSEAQLSPRGKERESNEREHRENESLSVFESSLRGAVTKEEKK